MKKIIIIFAVILTSTITALAITNGKTKSDDKTAIEKVTGANQSNVHSHTANLANAD